jgi:ABC-type sugar transport system ATPase subunit
VPGLATPGAAEVIAHTDGEDLRPDQRQMVEIARALSMDTRILILDEPTSSLDSHEAEALFEVIRSLKRHGVAVVFVSHRIDELFTVSDGITALRDGRTVAEGPLDQFSPDSVIAARPARAANEPGRPGPSWHQASSRVPPSSWRS